MPSADILKPTFSMQNHNAPLHQRVSEAAAEPLHAAATIQCACYSSAIGSAGPCSGAAQRKHHATAALLQPPHTLAMPP